MAHIPDYVIVAVTALLDPFVHAPSADVERALLSLDGSKRMTAPLGAIAQAWGIPKKTLYSRLCKAGVRPVRLGGRTGREAVYNIAACEPYRSLDAASLVESELKKEVMQ